MITPVHGFQGGAEPSAMGFQRRIFSRGAMRVYRLIQGFLSFGRTFFAGQGWIARKLKCSVRSVQRWTAELISAALIERRRRSQMTSVYIILRPLMAGQMAGQMAGRYKEEPSVVSPSEKQHHRDDAELEPIRKAAGIERLSEGDRRYLGELRRSGKSSETIRAGVLLGRARNIAAYVPGDFQNPQAELIVLLPQEGSKPGSLPA